MYDPYSYDESKELAFVKAGKIMLKIPHDPQTASESPYLVRRANNMGFMLTHLDPLGEAFIDFCKRPELKHIVDLDVSYGLSTAYFLQKNKKNIIATDTHPLHLKILQEAIPMAYSHRLSLRHGNFPEEISFENGSIDVFHSSRMFHFYEGERIKNILKAVFNALKRKGKFFLSTDTPYWGIWKEQGFLKKFEMKKQRGDPWPGFMENVSFYAPKSQKNVPSFMNFLDQNTLKIHCEKVGFKVEESFYFARDTYPQALRLDGREGLGIIAVKP